MTMTISEEKMRSEIKRIPTEYLENVGEVSEPQDRPPVDPFSGSQEPFPLDPSLFEDEEKEKRLDSIATTFQKVMPKHDLNISVDWKQIMEKK